VRIGQLAAQTGFSVRTIRFYEQSGLLPAPHRTPAGYRSYDPDAVTRLRFVRSAQALGLSLAEIAEVLRIRDYQGPPCSYVAELLETHISALDTRIKELTALRDELRARHPVGDEPDPARCGIDQVCYVIEDDAPTQQTTYQKETTYQSNDRDHPSDGGRNRVT
jgi:MerR family transcriptional regulator, copper efflux regulator